MVVNAALRAGLFAPLFLAGCAALVAPVPEPVPALSASRRSVEAAARAASEANAARCRNAGDLDCFYGGMGEMLDVVAARRLDYAQRARTSINDTALYNALLYPTGALVLYRRLRGSPHSGLLFPASVAAGAYGFMTSGAPEIHKHYLRGAREMLCLEVRYSEWVYRNGDILWREPEPAADEPLETLIANLTIAINEYALVRAEVLLKLRAPSAPGGPADAFDRARGVGGGGAKKDRRADLERYTGDQLTIARNTLDQLNAIKRELKGAQARLERELADLERDVQSGISDHVPALLDPQVVASALKDRIAKAQAGMPGPSRLDPLIPLELREGVRDSDSKGKQLADLAASGAKLQAAWVAARSFGLGHLERAAQVAADAESLRCRQRSEPVPAPAPAPAPAVGAPASAPLPPQS